MKAPTLRSASRPAAIGPHPCRLPLTLASVGFILMGRLLSPLYNHLHWDVLFTPARAPPAMAEDTRRQLIALLDAMDLRIRALGLIGLLFAFWALHGRPRWPAVAVLMVAMLIGLSLVFGIT